MNEIRLFKINKNENRIEYEFTCSEGITSFFSGRKFWIEYSENIAGVPDSIAAIPFVCNVLPIIWLTDSNLVVTDLDKTFFESIQDIKEGYRKMFPETEWGGEIFVSNVIPCEDIEGEKRSAMFYSGGVDSAYSLLMHYDEKPELLSIWGSDVQTDNIEGWSELCNVILETANRFHLNNMFIKSSFRQFDNEKELDNRFSAQLHDGWWHGVKHGIALLGHVAPIAYLHGLEKMYIASSNCVGDADVRCASHPSIDNNVRFVNCTVVHDGFQYSRQQKLHHIVYAQGTEVRLPLHVCWESQTGGNCCHCEKCYRTIAGIIVEGGDPIKYGFENYKTYLKDMESSVCQLRYAGAQKSHWTKIQQRLLENEDALKTTQDWKHIKWIKKKDFLHPKMKKSVNRIFRSWLSQYPFYQELHKWKKNNLQK